MMICPVVTAAAPMIPLCVPPEIDVLTAGSVIAASLGLGLTEGDRARAHVLRSDDPGLGAAADVELDAGDRLPPKAVGLHLLDQYTKHLQYVGVLRGFDGSD